MSPATALPPNSLWGILAVRWMVTGGNSRQASIVREANDRRVMIGGRRMIRKALATLAGTVVFFGAVFAFGAMIGLLVR